MLPANDVPLFSLGIDPGWRNLGWALVMEAEEPGKVTVVEARHLNPSTYHHPSGAVAETLKKVESSIPFSACLRHIRIERYVSYGNVRSTETESITEIIGMFRYALWENYGGKVDISLLRAIEWKTTLVKLLSRHYGFSNPSKKMELDKKFSIGAAKFVTTNPEVITNDHIADAICLAALPILQRGTETVA